MNSTGNLHPYPFVPVVIYMFGLDGSLHRNDHSCPKCTNSRRPKHINNHPANVLGAFDLRQPWVPGQMGPARKLKCDDKLKKTVDSRKRIVLD
jgi:hypothetical protein